MTANNFGIRFSTAGPDRIDFTGGALGASIRNEDNFSLEMWFKVNESQATSGSQFMYLERQGTGTYPRLSAAAWNSSAKEKGYLRFSFARVDGTKDTKYTYTRPTIWDDYWHHGAFTVNIGDKEYCIYVDGGLVATGKIPDGGLDGSSNPLTVSNTAPLSLIMGANYDGTTYTYWGGKIDNVRLWNSVLSESAVSTDRFDHVADPTGTASLIEEWRLNLGSGTSTAGIKNVSWTGTLKRAGSASSQLWNTDRAFMGDGDLDETPPPDNTMTAPTSITSDGFTLNWTSSTDLVYTQYYEIEISTTNTFSALVGDYTPKNVLKENSEVVTGLSPSTAYYARVRAVDAAANASNWVTYNSNAAITTSANGDLNPPDAPVATAATSVTSSQFIANWNVAADTGGSGLSGYKLDVALEDTFENFAPGWRNLDVGNVTTKTVNTGLDPETTYYYRVRAYDGSDNESNDSNSVTVNTSPLPDTSPPSISVTIPATSITSSSFTANWNVGVDNVGVTGYLLYVAYDDDFSTHVDGYNGLDVGNVTSYGLTLLSQQTTYYYRVRAYDAAGNVSDHATDYETVRTLISTVEEGGTYEVIENPIEDTYTNQAATTTNYGTSSTLIAGNVGSAIKNIYLKFNLSEYIGTLETAMLRFYVSDASVGTFSVKKVTAGTWSENVLTYTNASLTLSSTPTDFVPLATGWMEVDISALVTTAAEYTFVIYTSSTDTMTIASREDLTHVPELIIGINPTTTTEVQTFTASADNLSFTNLLKNPSAEIGGTAFGGSTGITLLTSATLLQDNTYAYDGTYSCKVVSATSSGSGVKFESATGLAIAGTGQTVSGKLFIKSVAAYSSVTAKLRLTYTDASTTDGTSVTLISHADWRHFEVTAVATNAKTVDKVEIHILQSDTTARTYWVDAAAVYVAGGTNVVHWNGATSPDTDWDGTANASTSTYNGASLSGISTYVGDSDEDNSVAVAFKRSAESDWITRTGLTASINRGTKQVTASVHPPFMSNYCYNPSFTVNTSLWSTGGVAGTTLTRIITDGMEEVGSSDLACLQVVGTGAGANQGAYSDQMIPAVQGETIAFSVYMKSVSGALTNRLVIKEISSAEATLVTATENETITTSWARYDYVYTTVNASTKMIQVAVVNPNATAATWLLDWVMVDKNSTVNPYIDGDSDDGEWEGLDHNSATYRVLRHEVDYDLQFTVTDPDGVTGTNPWSATATTPHVPDDALTVETLTLTPMVDSIDISVSYTGDENETGEAVLHWKRSDLATWSRQAFSWNRTDKTLSTTLGGLKSGTSYDVRFTFTDDDDVVYGSNPITESATTLVPATNADSPQRVSFDGFLLADSQTKIPYWVMKHDAAGHPDRRTQIEVLPRVHGGALLSDYWGKRTITIEGGVEGETLSELADNIQALRKALAPADKHLVVDTLDSTSYYFVATCTSFPLPQEAGGSYRHMTWSATFECADPFRYSAAESVDTGLIFTDASTAVISNSGDIDCDPIITITTTNTVDTTISVTNVTTGDRIKPLVTMSAGDTLTIDSTRLNLTLNGIPVDYDGGFPILLSGPNTLKVSLSSGSVRATVRRRHRFL